MYMGSGTEYETKVSWGLILTVISRDGRRPNQSRMY